MGFSRAWDKIKDVGESAVDFFTDPANLVTGGSAGTTEKTLDAATSTVAELSGAKKAEEEALAGISSAEEASERNLLRQLQFLRDQQIAQRRDISDITGAWGAFQGGYQQDLMDAMRQYGMDREGAGKLWQLGGTAALDKAYGMGLGQLGMARQDMMKSTGGLGQMGLSALGQMGQIAGQPLDIESYLNPGMQFRMRQGQEAITTGAAAAGMGMSGKTLKSLSRFGQNLASQEYGAAFQRASADRAQRLSALGQIGGYGAGALGQQAGLLSQLGIVGAGLTPNYLSTQYDPRSALVDYTPAIQDPGAIQAARLSALTGVSQQYTGAGSQAIQQAGADQLSLMQNESAIRAQSAMAPWNSLMGLGTMAGGLMTGYGAIK